MNCLKYNNYKPGRGYRLVKAGEYMKKSDEFWNGYEWTPMTTHWRGKRDSSDCQVRRKLKNKGEQT